MIALQLAFAVLFPVLVGYSFINLFLNNKEDAGLLERLSLGFCAGLMLISLEMFFVLSPLKTRFSVASISFPLLLIVLAGLYVSIKNGLLGFRLRTPERFKPLEIGLLILIVIQIIFVSLSLMIKPVSGWDSWAIYSLFGKAYYMEGSAFINTLGTMVQRQHNALAQAWTFVCIGQWNEILGKMNFCVYYAALIAIFYFAVRRFSPRLTSLLATYMLSTLPFLVYHATLEYSDLLMSIYLFIGIYLMFLWFEKRNTRHIALSAFFLLSTLIIKKESFFHLAIILIIFLATVFTAKFKDYKNIKKVRTASIYLFAAGMIFALIRFFMLPYDGTKMSSAIEFSRLWPMISVFYDYVFVRSNWSIIFFMLIALLIFKGRKLREGYNLNLLGLIILEFIGFFAYYFVAEQSTYSWLYFVTPAVRNILQFVPLMVLLIARILPEGLLPGAAK